MRELHVQAGVILYACSTQFDSRRAAIFLTAGDKTGDDRWYDINVPIADRLFERHLKTSGRRDEAMARKFRELTRRCRLSHWGVFAANQSSIVWYITRLWPHYD